MTSENSDQIFLKLNNFENGRGYAFTGFQNKSEFYDVTLACEDSQVTAHKLILRSCSPFSIQY